MKTEQLHIRITPELKEKLQAAAEAENRTISNYIVTLIEREMKKRTAPHGAGRGRIL